MDRKIPMLAEERSHSEQCWQASLTLSLNKGTEKRKVVATTSFFQQGTIHAVLRALKFSIFMTAWFEQELNSHRETSQQFFCGSILCV